MPHLLTQLEMLYAMSHKPSAAPPHQAPSAVAVTTRPLDPETVGHVLPGAPDRPPHFIIEHTSHPADLRVTIFNYGERQPGAEDVLLQLSRPVAGQQLFTTTNGNAGFSDNGAYLLLTMPFLLIAVDAHTMHAWHYALPDRTMLLRAGWTHEGVVGQLVAYGKRAAEAEPLGPWAWGELIRTWQPGLGRAATAVRSLTIVTTNPSRA